MHRRSRGFVVGWAIALAATGGHAAEPPGPSIDEERSAGVAAYQRGDHEAALVHFQRAYELAPALDLVYAMAQSERALGRCDRAVPLYERFIAETDSAQQVRAAQANLERCQEAGESAVEPPGEVSKERVIAPQPEPGSSPAAPASTPEPNPEGARAATPKDGSQVSPSARSAEWHRDPLGGTLVATGTALGAIGTVLFVQAGGEAETARDEAAHPARGDYQSTIDDFNAINRKRQTSRVMVLGGGVLVGLGVWRYLSLAGERTEVALSETELRVRVGGRF